MFLQNFIDDQKRFLSLERLEEINQSKIISESPPKILEEKNLCIRKLKIVNIFTGLFGRTIVELECQQKTDNSSKRVFSQGDIIAICNDVSKNDVSKPIATGLFYKLTKDCIQIALDSEIEDNMDIRGAEGTMLRLVKLSSEVTYQRLKAGLKYLEKRTNPLCGDYLIDLLMGNTGLRIPDPQKEISFFNKNLNSSQKEAVQFAISRPDIAIIHGPPGTGKTTVAVEIISQIIVNLQKHKCSKILVCTPSNIALDNLAEKLLKVEFSGKNDKISSGRNVNLLRLGHSARVMSHLSDISIDYKLSVCDQAELISQVRSQIDWTLNQSFNKNGKRIDKRRELGDLRKELRERELKAVREVLSSSQVIMSTLTGLRSNKSLPLNEIEFDVVIIDEVSQAIEAACWLAIPRGKKLILAGDHKQLPPTVLSVEAIKAGLGRSLMERLLDLFPPIETTRMLKCQYRMHEKIMQWSSDTFYESSLVADSSVAQHLLNDICKDNDCDLGPLEPLVFIDTENSDLWELDSLQEDSKGNLGEAHLAAVYIKYLVERFQLLPIHIGVITPYSRQVQLIKQCLKDKVKFESDFDASLIEISTVDGFQGREKEVIVTTLVRSNPTGVVGFLAESRRLNVALTRAKRHLCVIGDSSTIKKSNDKNLHSLVEYWNSVAEIHSAHEYIYDNDINAGECVKAKPSAKKKSNSKNIIVESKDLENKLCDQLRKFKLNANESTLEFSSELNPRLRALLHELSEELQLNHVSVGDGSSRRLIVSKPIKFKVLHIDDLTEDLENNFFDNETKSIPHEENVCSVVNSDKNKYEILPSEEANIWGNGKETTLNSNELNKLGKNESKEIGPKINDISHMIRLKSEHVGQMLKEKENTSRNKTYKPIKEKSKKTHNNKKEIVEISEDFDTMIEQFQQMNKVCQHISKCSTPVAVLGFDCRFCNKRFCSSHALPEVHECHQATLSAWRTNGVKSTSKKQEIKHAQLKLAMARKIDGMTAERTAHPKKK